MNALADFWASANAFFWIGLLVSSIVGFALGYLASVLAGPHTKRFTERVEGGAVRDLLQLNGADVIIVVPHQPGPHSRRLPQLAVEDVLALRNIFDVLAEIGIKNPKIRHPENLDDSDFKKNIITIGGSIRNAFTAEVLRWPVNGDILEFVRSSIHPNQVELHRGPTTVYHSPSYDEATSDQPRATSKDVALILRRPNPRSETKSVLVVAGIRGTGTWGASDYLRKHARALAERVSRDQGGAMAHGFLALLEVEYQNFDISRTKVKDVASILDDA
ncbi:hypothetical protein [Ideonella paludis]|uniref:Uncharacterized protein n=1 Tax=Ideonella paludis TaxID=1233411 RepID=A0ABS5DXP1_9BURK|nr:hypothetical protein [Ideonella paludis]MBQ0935921.1 hypothetical protein [Ideonella paludis]